MNRRITAGVGIVLLTVIAGIVAIPSLPEYFVYFVAGPAVGITLFATVYSYLDYRRLDNGDPAEG